MCIFAVIVLALLVLVVAGYALPGFFGFMAVVLILGFIIMCVVAHIKTVHDLKDFDKELEDIEDEP